MNKKLKLGIENFSIVDDMSDDQLAIVEVYVCHDGNNLHDMPIELSVLKNAKKTLKNKFLVAGYDGDDFEADMAKMAADPETQRWWAECTPCQQPVETAQEGELWAEMEEVFHLD